MRLVRISRQAVADEVFLHIANVTLEARLQPRGKRLPRTKDMVLWEELHLRREDVARESAAYQDFWRCAYRARLAVYIHKDEEGRTLSSLAIEAAYDTTGQLRSGDVELRQLLARRGVY